jgi:hypothetical protein
MGGSVRGIIIAVPHLNVGSRISVSCDSWVIHESDLCQAILSHRRCLRKSVPNGALVAKSVHTFGRPKSVPACECRPRCVNCRLISVDYFIHCVEVRH